MVLLPRPRLRYFTTRAKTKYFVTTPIYYVNASKCPPSISLTISCNSCPHVAPHIGHLYSSLLADASQRWFQLMNPDVEVFFLTGTDEHGSKIQRAAQVFEESPESYCGRISKKYRELSENFGISYTDFIRTTEERHVSAVQSFWVQIANNCVDNVKLLELQRTLRDNGHINLSKYSGWYCLSDETFLGESQLKERKSPDGTLSLVSVESGHPVEWCEEENYMFKLGRFRDDLRHWLKENGSWNSCAEFDGTTQFGLQKTSLSRRSFTRFSLRWWPGKSCQIYRCRGRLLVSVGASRCPRTKLKQFTFGWMLWSIIGRRGEHEGCGRRICMSSARIFSSK